MPKKEIDIQVAQKVFKEFEKETPKHFRSEVCPKKCIRKQLGDGNYPKCRTPDSCVKLQRKPKAMLSVKIATGQVKKRIRKFDKRDLTLLHSIKSYPYQFPPVDRSEVKRQLNELGLPVPRLSHSDIKLQEINAVRKKLGLWPLKRRRAI